MPLVYHVFVTGCVVSIALTIVMMGIPIIVIIWMMEYYLETSKPPNY